MHEFVASAARLKAERDNRCYKISASGSIWRWWIKWCSSHDPVMAMDNRHILILNEGQEAGVPVWRFAASRDEAVYVYAPWEARDCEQEALVDLLRQGTIDQERFDRAVRDYLACTPPWPDDVWMRTVWKPWAAVDLGGYEDKAYAVYLPCSEKDFAGLWYGHDDRGPVIVAAPSELGEEHAKALSLIESKVRPLRYLKQADLCSELKVPWAYLLGIYYESSLSLFIAESASMIAAVTELTKGVKECQEIPPKQLAGLEKYDWLRDGQLEEKPRLTEEQKEKHRHDVERFSRERRTDE